jgi:NitT/TauT family transport system substrate-binding protein
MNFSTSSRAKKSQAALFAVLVAGSLLAATPVSNAAAAVKIGAACSKANAIASATNGKTVTCKSNKWTAYKTATLKFGSTASSYAPKEEFAVYAVPKKAGFFAAENLDVTVFPANGSLAAAQLVASGVLDIAGSDLGSAQKAIEAGGNIVVIGGMVVNWPWLISVKDGSPIKTPADLKGKTIGIVSFVSGSYPYAKAFLEANNMTEKDVKLVAVGGAAGPANAQLQSGAVDALSFYGSAYADMEFAGTKLSYLKNPDYMKAVRSLSWVANADKYAANPEVFERFLRATFKGLIYSKTNISSATKLGLDEFPQTLLGKTVAERLPSATASLKAWVDSATPTTGTPATWKPLGSITKAEWVVNQDYAKKAGDKVSNVDFEDFLDTSVLARANTFDRAKVIAKAKAAK